MQQHSRGRGEQRTNRTGGAWARRLFLGAGLLALAVAGCGGGSEMGGDGGGSDGGTCPTFAQVSIWPLCTTCHSSALTGAAREEAPEGVDFDVYASAANNAATAQIYIMAKVMPPPEDPQPTAAQIASFDKWFSCGTPP